MLLSDFLLTAMIVIVKVQKCYFSWGATALQTGKHGAHPPKFGYMGKCIKRELLNYNESITAPNDSGLAPPMTLFRSKAAVKAEKTERRIKIKMYQRNRNYKPN